MKKHEVKLHKLAGCKDCGKNCMFNSSMATEETSGPKYGCNSSKEE